MQEQIYACGPDCCYSYVSWNTYVCRKGHGSSVATYRSFWTCCHCENPHDVAIWGSDCPICGHHMDGACTKHSYADRRMRTRDRRGIPLDKGGIWLGRWGIQLRNEY